VRVSFVWHTRPRAVVIATSNCFERPRLDTDKIKLAFYRRRHKRFFCPLLKISSYHSYLKFLDFSQLLVADTPLWIFFSIKFVYTLWQNFLDTQYKNIFFFALIKKIFSQNLVEIIFRYHKKYFWIFGTPLQPKRRKVKVSHGVLGIKIGWKGSLEFISEGIFDKYSKIKILVFEIFEKGQIFRPFFWPSTLKTKTFTKKINGSICAYRVFHLPIFRRIEGGWGWNPPSPPPVLFLFSSIAQKFETFLILQKNTVL